jgi:hypothetical protein
MASTKAANAPLDDMEGMARAFLKTHFKSRAPGQLASEIAIRETLGARLWFALTHLSLVRK